MTNSVLRQLILIRKTKGKRVIFAHRGVSSLANDNSLMALKLGIQMKEVDGVEFDVQETKDHQLIVYHNFTVPVGGSQRWVRDVTYKDLRKIYQEDECSTLAEALSLFRNSDKIIDIEVKSPGIVERIVSIAKKLSVYDRLVLTSINKNLNREIREVDPQLARFYGYPRDRGKNLAMQTWTKPFVRTVVSVMKWRLPTYIADMMSDVKTPFISLYHKVMTKDVVDIIHERGGFCFGVTINLHNDLGISESLKAMQEITDKGADGIKTDYPQLAPKIINPSFK